VPEVLPLHRQREEVDYTREAVITGLVWPVANRVLDRIVEVVTGAVRWGTNEKSP